MVSENVTGSGSSASSAALEFRVPPAQATTITAWLGELGTVTSKNVKATEVSKTLFDQELALKNLDLTMTRLQVLAEKGGPIDQVLAIEKEMTRVRGDIERIKGENRWLLDRVAYATITVNLTREGDEQYDVIPEARMYPGPQLSTLVLIDPGMHQRTRVGGGASVRVHRLLTFDLSVFPRGEGGESRAVVATAGTALYSAYLGYGQRKYFNPYVGARAGYGYFDGRRRGRGRARRRAVQARVPPRRYGDSRARVRSRRGQPGRHSRHPGRRRTVLRRRRSFKVRSDTSLASRRVPTRCCVPAVRLPACDRCESPRPADPRS
jgi:hypothetical protein